MRSKFAVVGILCCLLRLSPAFAADSTAENGTEELGMDQKLARVYELYQKGSNVSLKQNEMQMGLGIAYTTSNTDSFGMQQSIRLLATQMSASYGIGADMEASVTLPYLAQSLRVQTQTTEQNSTISGIGDPAIRLIRTLPTQNVSTSLIASATLPLGRNDLSQNETHLSFGTYWSKVLRPAFVSGGLSYERDTTSRLNSIGYSAGLGFFINHALSLGGEVDGVILLNPTAGMARDNMTLGFKVAYQADPDFGIVASTNFGVASSTPRATIGLSTYWRY